jgi:hypothetical protein
MLMGTCSSEDTHEVVFEEFNHSVLRFNKLSSLVPCST